MYRLLSYFWYAHFGKIIFDLIKIQYIQASLLTCGKQSWNIEDKCREIIFVMHDTQVRSGQYPQIKKKKKRFSLGQGSNVL